jgi:hypothetical protein
MPPASEISVEGGRIEEMLHTETSDYPPLPSSTRTITSMDGMGKLMDKFPLPSPKPGAFRVHLPLACTGRGSDAFAMASDILLVDDDDGTSTGHDVVSYYRDALTHSGYAYDYWDTSSSGSPSLATLQGYSTVIWFTGFDFASTLSSSDESILASYLDAGGSLFLCSQDYLYDRGLTSFGTDYLHIGSYTNDTGVSTVVGVAGDPVGNGLGPYTLSYPFADYSDDLLSDGSSLSSFARPSGGNPVALTYAGDGYKAAFFAFPFEALSSADADVMMNRIITWFESYGFSIQVRNQAGDPAIDAYVQVYSDINAGAEYTGYTDDTGWVTFADITPGTYTVVVTSGHDHFVVVREGVSITPAASLFLDTTNTVEVDVYTYGLDGVTPVDAGILFCPSRTVKPDVGGTGSGGYLKVDVTPRTYDVIAGRGASEPYLLVKPAALISGPTDIVFNPVQMATGQIEFHLDDFERIRIGTWGSYSAWSWEFYVDGGERMTFSPDTYNLAYPDLVKSDEAGTWYYALDRDSLYSAYPVHAGEITAIWAGGNFNAKTALDRTNYSAGEWVSLTNSFADAYGNEIMWVSEYTLGQSMAQERDNQYAVTTMARSGKRAHRPRRSGTQASGWSDVYPTIRVKDPNGQTIVDESSRAARRDFAFALPAGSVEGLYTVELSLDTGPHQGLVSASNWFCVGTCSMPTPTATPTAVGTPTSLDYGMCATSAEDQILEMIRNAGFGWVLHYVSWARSEPVKGHYDWSWIDDAVRKSEAHGLKTILRIDRPPAWANGGISTAPPTDPDDLGDFVHALVSHFGNGVAAYQIWNEPNLALEWGNRPPNASRYVDLLRIAYVRAKQANPHVIIVSAGLATTNDRSGTALDDRIYLQEMYNAGAKRYFDVLGANPLGFSYSPDDTTDPNGFNFSRIQELHNIMINNGDGGKQVWAMEVGWLHDTTVDLGIYNWMKVSEEQQAEYLARAFQKAYNEWPWMGVMFVWNLDFSAYYSPASERYWFSTIDRGYVPRQAYLSLRSMSKPPATYTPTPTPTPTSTPTPTPTNTPTPTPTHTPTPTPTHTPTSTPTASPTSTPTPAGRTVYLPMILRVYSSTTPTPTPTVTRTSTPTSVLPPTWVRSGATGIKVISLALDPAHPDIVYAGTAGDEGVFKRNSCDGYWQSKGLRNLGTTVLAVAANGHVYAGTWGYGVRRSTNGGSSWTPAGLDGKRIRSIIAHPTNSQVIYAGTVDEGIYKTNSGGTSWQDVTHNLGSRNIAALAINPSNAQVVYAGTADGGVYRSGDGGGTWVERNNGLSDSRIWALAINPNSPQVVYAATTGGVYKSSNGGGSWAAMDLNMRTRALAIHPLRPQHVYAGTWNNGVHRSTDGGVSWSPWNQELGDLFIKALALDTAGCGVIYAGTEQNGVWERRIGE